MSAPPPLPTPRALTAELRALHSRCGSHPDAGGEYVSLVFQQQCLGEPPQWRVVAVGQVGSLCLAYDRAFTLMVYGREFIPGSVEQECGCSWEGGRVPCFRCRGSGRVRSPSPFDATAAARRLLAAARDGMRGGVA